MQQQHAQNKKYTTADFEKTAMALPNFEGNIYATLLINVYNPTKISMELLEISDTVSHWGLPDGQEIFQLNGINIVPDDVKMAVLKALNFTYVPAIMSKWFSGRYSKGEVYEGTEFEMLFTVFYVDPFSNANLDAYHSYAFKLNRTTNKMEFVKGLFEQHLTPIAKMMYCGVWH